MLKEPMIFTTLFIICLAVDKLAGGGPGMTLAGLTILEIVIRTSDKIFNRRASNE